MEECVGIDDQILREVIIPVMAIDRRAKDGTTHEDEPVNKSQIYINFLVILSYLFLRLPLEQRKDIYKIFCDSVNFVELKTH